ncbi:MAG TPA: glycosyltransferase family 2 protein [Saprospiraceae bacterium]|nr:glycosyltransferase family 2 protein [Saprospiraceae bacterium]
MIIDVIIPALNEANSIGLVLQNIPNQLVRHIVVADNGSTDETARIAEENGATVVSAPQKGYGTACLTGMAYIQNLSTQPDIVVFLDGDFSDYPEQMPDIVRPIVEGDMDLVIGSRALGQCEGGAMTLPQKFGNWLATTLIRWIYGYHFTDLGPFRAITWAALQKLDMQDPDFGWTAEMQVKAARKKLKTTEVPVNYKKRIGISKVSGTIKGSLLAGYKILKVVFRGR